MTVDVLGNTTADILVDTDRFPLGTAAEFSPASLAVTGHSARLRVGGNAGRTAAILGQLGLAVRLHTALGRDVWGGWALEQLTRAGVEVLGAVAGTTSTNCVATDGAGCRLSFFYPGAREYGAPAPKADTEFLVVAACPFPDPTGLRRWLPAFHDAEIRVLVDLGPSLFERPGLDHLDCMAGPRMHLTMNESELQGLTGCRAMTDGVHQLHRAGISTVAIKMGSRGALVSTAPRRLAWRVPTDPFPPGQHTTVGAGDCFNAGFVYGLMRGFDAPRSAALGNRLARWVHARGDQGLGDPGELLADLEADCAQIEEV